jgi:hypothetical protein
MHKQTSNVPCVLSGRLYCHVIPIMLSGKYVDIMDIWTTTMSYCVRHAIFYSSVGRLFLMLVNGPANVKNKLGANSRFNGIRIMLSAMPPVLTWSSKHSFGQIWRHICRLIYCTLHRCICECASSFYMWQIQWITNVSCSICLPVYHSQTTGICLALTLSYTID